MFGTKIEDKEEQVSSFQLKLLKVGTRVGSLESTPGSGQRELFWEHKESDLEHEHGADMVVIQDGAGFEIPPISAGGDSGGGNGYCCRDNNEQGTSFSILAQDGTKSNSRGCRMPIAHR